MIYKAYELKTRLSNLVLAGSNEEKELEFIGTDKQWDKTEKEIDRHENPVCEECGGSGMIEVLGDGDNFEVDVIGHKKCSNCNQND